MISVCVACLCADANDFHRPKAKLFVCKLSSEKKNACKIANVFFRQETRHTKSFDLG
jgi:hypothetical protein